MSCQNEINRVGILFDGGPAPATNAVISTCAASFLRNDIEVVGILYGYSGLIEFAPDRPLEVGRNYVVLDHVTLRRTRNKQGIMIGTARTNPGRFIESPADLDDPHKTSPLASRLRRPVFTGIGRPGFDRR